MASRQNGLKVIELSRVEVDNLKDCGICIDSFAIGDKSYLLQCYHVYHKECLEEWWNRDFTCPCCRTDCAQSVGVGGEDGMRRRKRKFIDWECERVATLRGKKISEWRDCDLRIRIEELCSDSKVVGKLRTTQREELIEILLLLDPAAGVRITRHEAPAAPPTTREMLSRLASAFVPTDGITEKADLIALYSRTFLENCSDDEGEEPEEDLLQVEDTPDNALNFTHLSTLSLKDLKAVALGMDVDLAGVLERDEIYTLIQDAFTT